MYSGQSYNVRVINLNVSLNTYFSSPLLVSVVPPFINGSWQGVDVDLISILFFFFIIMYFLNKIACMHFNSDA